MNEKDKVIFLIIAATVLTVIVSFAGLFGLDFLTSAKVLAFLCIFSAGVFATLKLELFSIKLIPIFLVWLLACFRPAYNFWAYGSESSSLYAVKIYREIPWYANDWIQLGIAASILILGHLIVLKINDEI